MVAQIQTQNEKLNFLLERVDKVVSNTEGGKGYGDSTPGGTANDNDPEGLVLDPTVLEPECETDEAYDSDCDNYADYNRLVNPTNVSNLDELKQMDGDSGINLMTIDELYGAGFKSTEQKTDSAVNQRFMAVLPWLGQIVEPSNPPASSPYAPEKDLELEWVYGVRVQDSRNNIAVNTKGRVIYPCAGVVVEYNSEAHTQRHFTGHTDDILCLAQNPADADVVATGQVATIDDRGRATMPHICVWNTRTNLSYMLKNAHKRAVRCLGFSKSGNMLASVGYDDKFTVKVWNYENEVCVASASADVPPHKVFALYWIDDEHFVTCGSKHLYFWTFQHGTLRKRRAMLTGSNYPLQTFYSITTLREYVLVTTRSGSIYVLKNGASRKAIAAHSGPIYSIVTSADGEYVLSGGKDGYINIYDRRMRLLRRISFDGEAVRSLALIGPNVVASTSRAEVFVLQYTDMNSTPHPLFAGHHDGELWALDVIDRVGENRFVTAGEDNKIVVWDYAEHKTHSVLAINEKSGQRRRRRRASTMSSEPENRCARAVSYNSHNQHMAFGLNNGEITIFDSRTNERVQAVDLNRFAKNITMSSSHSGRDSFHGHWIQTMCYSPNGKTLAVGTHGSVIILLDVTSGYRHGCTLTSHNAAVTHLDWSKDSTCIRSNCRAYELLFHDIDQSNLAKSKMNPHASQLRDVEWDTTTCVLGWGVQGIFSSSQDGTDVNCCDRSPDGSILATGDDYGYVNLFRYPCTQKGNEKHVKVGHSSHVMNVKFSPDGKYLFSVGGNDKAVMQWRVR